MRSPLFTRISAAHMALQRFATENDLKLKFASGLNDRYARLIVTAITSGVQPLDWREQVAAKASLTDESKSDSDGLEDCSKSWANDKLSLGRVETRVYPGLYEMGMKYVTTKMICLSQEILTDEQ